MSLVILSLSNSTPSLDWPSVQADSIMLESDQSFVQANPIIIKDDPDYIDLEAIDADANDINVIDKKSANAVKTEAKKDAGANVVSKTDSILKTDTKKNTEMHAAVQTATNELNQDTANELKINKTILTTASNVAVISALIDMDSSQTSENRKK